MAGKADNIQDEITKRREGIAETRLAITDKLTVLDDRVQHGVDDVQHAFDLRYQVNHRPWLMIGASILVGYAIRRRGGLSIPAAPLPSKPLSNAPPRPHIVSEVKTHFKEDIAAIKGAVFGAVISTLWAMARQALLSRARQMDAIAVQPDAPRSGRQRTTSLIIASKTNGRSAV
jgi:hypothetical protein